MELQQSLLALPPLPSSQLQAPALLFHLLCDAREDIQFFWASPEVLYLQNRKMNPTSSEGNCEAPMTVEKVRYEAWFGAVGAPLPSVGPGSLALGGIKIPV